MNCLEEFENNIFLYDSMLIETKGAFSTNKAYTEKCCEIAEKYFLSTGSKKELLNVINMKRQSNGSITALKWIFYLKLNKELNYGIAGIQNYLTNTTEICYNKILHFCLKYY